MKPAIFGNRKRAIAPFKSWIDNFGVTDNFFDDDMLVFRNQWSPAVNIKDHKNDFEIEVEAPGLEKDDFLVTVDKGMLCISAEKETDVEEKDENYTRREFRHNSFERSFTLPDNIDANNIDAKYSNGILKLKLKKVNVVKSAAKKIAIK